MGEQQFVGCVTNDPLETRSGDFFDARWDVEREELSAGLNGDAVERHATRTGSGGSRRRRCTAPSLSLGAGPETEATAVRIHRTGSDRPGVSVAAGVDFVLDLRHESFCLGLLGEGFAALDVAVVAPAHLPTLPPCLPVSVACRSTIDASSCSPCELLSLARAIPRCGRQRRPGRLVGLPAGMNDTNHSVSSS